VSADVTGGVGASPLFGVAAAATYAAGEGVGVVADGQFDYATSGTPKGDFHLGANYMHEMVEAGGGLAFASVGEVPNSVDFFGVWLPYVEARGKIRGDMIIDPMVRVGFWPGAILRYRVGGGVVLPGGDTRVRIGLDTRGDYLQWTARGNDQWQFAYSASLHVGIVAGDY
jgi:hypothetical protein